MGWDYGLWKHVVGFFGVGFVFGLVISPISLLYYKFFVDNTIQLPPSYYAGHYGRRQLAPPKGFARNALGRLVGMYAAFWEGDNPVGESGHVCGRGALLVRESGGRI